MPFGFNGKILHVDLDHRLFAIEEPPEAFYRKYGGGTGMASYYLIKKMPAGVDPLDPENVLAVFVGPATGAAVSGQSRVAVVAKSPLTPRYWRFASRWVLPSDVQAYRFRWSGDLREGRSTCLPVGSRWRGRDPRGKPPLGKDYG